MAGVGLLIAITFLTLAVIAVVCFCRSSPICCTQQPRSRQRDLARRSTTVLINRDSLNSEGDPGFMSLTGLGIHRRVSTENDYMRMKAGVGRLPPIDEAARFQTRPFSPNALPQGKQGNSDSAATPTGGISVNRNASPLVRSRGRTLLRSLSKAPHKYPGIEEKKDDDAYDYPTLRSAFKPGTGPRGAALKHQESEIYDNPKNMIDLDMTDLDDYQNIDGEIIYADPMDVRASYMSTESNYLPSSPLIEDDDDYILTQPPALA